MKILTNTYICAVRIIKTLFDFYIFSNMHVAMAGFGLTAITLKKYGHVDYNIPLFVGCCIVLAYNFIRFYQLSQNLITRRRNWIVRNKIGVIILCLLALFGILYSAVNYNFDTMSVGIVLLSGVITSFYVVPVLNYKGQTVSIRSVPGLKIFGIAFSWTLMTVLFPIVLTDQKLNTEVLLVFMQRLVFLVVITLPFDIRDMKSDLPSLKTIPQILGLKGSKFVAITLLLVFILLEIGIFKTGFPFSVLIVSIVAFILLLYSKPGSNEYFESFWVEGLPILWFILEVVILLD